MNRDKVTKEIQSIKANNILLELPTGMGKTKQALDLMSLKKPKSILVVIPRLVLINNWKDEFVKWGYTILLSKVTFSTYVSLHKLADKHFDLAIWDEAHHITNRCIEAFKSISIKENILLSATINKSKLATLSYNFKELYCYKVTAKEAINSSILPDPRVYLIPYKLDNTVINNALNIRSSNKGKKILCHYKDRWKYIKDKSYSTVEVLCTQAEYNYEISNKIDYLKRKYMSTRNEAIKNKWLYLSGLRLKALSNFKTDIIKTIQAKLKNHRTLTLCNSIEQSKKLSINSINSTDKESILLLEKFNKGEINHITACQMLNEGVNLNNCQVGIYASLNSSEVMILQKLGRFLRHSNPVLIIPYYVNTREAELVNLMIENYNPNLITIVDNLNQIEI